MLMRPLLPVRALPAFATCSRYPAKGRLETALTGEAVEVRRDLDLVKLRTDLQVGNCTAVRVLQCGPGQCCWEGHITQGTITVKSYKSSAGDGRAEGIKCAV